MDTGLGGLHCDSRQFREVREDETILLHRRGRHVLIPEESVGLARRSVL